MPRQSRLSRRISDYLDYLRAERFVSLHTLNNYERDLRHLAAWLVENNEIAANQDWKHIAHLPLRRYARSLGEYAQATQMRRLSAIRSFFGWLESEGVIAQNPAVRLAVFKTLVASPLVLTVAEIEKLMAAPDLLDAGGKRDRALLEVLYGAGLRSGECVALTLEDVNWRAGELLIRDANGSRGGPASRAVPLGRPALRALRDYMQNARPELASGRHTTKEPPVTNALWLSRRGSPLSQVALYQAVQGCARRAGLSQKITPHTLRDCCAAHLLQNGAAEAVVQELLGHRSPQIARRYQLAPRRRGRRPSESGKG